MANIALQARVSAKSRPELDIVGVPIDQMTLPAAEALTAGNAVRIVPSSTGAGRWTKANASDLTEGRVWGIATRTVVAGEAVTAVRNGILDGFDVASLAYGDPLYLSDTDGTIADSYGTVDVLIGRIVPGTATTLGTAYDRLVKVEIQEAASTDLDLITFSDDLMAASVDEWVWVAPVACVLTRIDEIHSVIGGSGAVVRPRKVTAAGTAAPGDAAGATVKELTTADIGLETTINVSQAPTLTATAADRVFAAGDKLAHNFGGTLTGLVGKITYAFKPI